MPDVRLMTTDQAPPDLLAGARALCDRAFTGGFDDHDWQHALGGWHAVVLDGADVVAHAAVVPRELHVAERPWQAGYVEAVATDPARQGRGHGRLAMAEIGAVVRRDYELGALATGSHGFYERMGWERWRGPTYVRRGPDLVRSADEDDGVMVLRQGPSQALDLTDAISCPGRAGDDW